MRRWTFILLIGVLWVLSPGLARAQAPPGEPSPAPTILPPEASQGATTDKSGADAQPLKELQKLQDNVRALQKAQAAAQAAGGAKEVQQKQLDVLQKQIEVQQKMIELLVEQLRKQTVLGPAVEKLQDQTATLEARGLQAARRDQQLAGALDDMKEQYDADRRNLPQLFPAQLRELFDPQQNNETPLSIYGVYHTDYNKLFNKPGGFNFGEFSPQFLIQLNQQFLLEAETTFGPNATPSLGRAQLDWLLGNHTVIVGYFESPIGFFNERLNHPWFNKFPDPPLMFLQVSPQMNFLGAQLRGAQYIFNSPIKLEYSIFLSNGLNTTASPPKYTDIANLEGLTNTFNFVTDNKAGGGRVGFWYPAIGLTGGLSGLWNGTYVGGVGDYLNLWQLDTGYNNGKGLDIRFEYAQTYQQGQGTIGANIQRHGLFGQIAYRPLTLPNGPLQKTEVAFRYSQTRFQGIDTTRLDAAAFASSLDVPTNRNQFTVGVNYYFYASLVLRVAYEINRELGITKFSDDQILGQLVWAF